MLFHGVRCSKALCRLVLCVLQSSGLLLVPSLFIVLGGSPVTAEEAGLRVERSMRFVPLLLSRELDCGFKLFVTNGRESFDNHSIPDRAADYAGKTKGALRSDRQVCYTLEYPSAPDAGLIKVLATRRRLLNINYKGGDTQSGIDSFVEGPLTDPFEGFASLVGEGVWFGYLARKKFPEVMKLTSGPAAIRWTQSPDGTQIRGVRDGWEIVFEYADALADQPLRVDMHEQRPKPEVVGVLTNRRVEFLEWDTYEAIVCPSRIATWDLVYTDEGKWETTYSTVTLDSVGPETPISDEYGEFFTDVPNGSQVQVNDYKGIDFVWENGDILRKVDGAKLSSLIGQRFFPSPLRRFLLIGTGIIVLAAFGWALWSQTGRSPRSLLLISAAMVASPGVAHSQDHYCGVYSAFSVLDYYQKPVAFEELLEPQYVSGFLGSTAKEVAAALTEHGLKASIDSGLGVFDLRVASGPMILHVRGSQGRRQYDHWIVYFGEAAGRAIVLDPSRGRTEIEYPRLLAMWDGIGIATSDSDWGVSVWRLLGRAQRCVTLIVLGCILYPIVNLLPSVSLLQSRWAGSALSTGCLLAVMSAGALALDWLNPCGVLGSSVARASIASVHSRRQFPVVELDEGLRLNPRPFDNHPSCIWIDARYRHDFELGHIPSSLNLPIDAAFAREDELVASIPKNSCVVVYCQSRGCPFAHAVSERLRGHGFVDVRIFAPGYAEWAQGGGMTERGSS